MCATMQTLPEQAQPLRLVAETFFLMEIANLKRYFTLPILFLLLFIAINAAPTPVHGQGFPRYCLEQKDKNLVKNCEFNEGLNNWTPFTVSGGADIKTIDGNACHTINHPCGYMSSGGAFVAGIYQQIPVEPGGIYEANAQLILYDSMDKQDGGVGRTIGLDPTGGTDPNSGAIVWGPEVWAFDHKHQMVFPELQVKANAQGNTMTVFVRISNQGRGGFTQIWFDEIGMIKVGQGEAPAPTPVPPTATPIPPTAAPAPAKTATPVPSDTPAPTDTPVPTDTPAPTATPIPTDTPTPTPSATSTPTATRTPLPTPIPLPTATPTPPSLLAEFLPAIGGGILCFSLFGIFAVIGMLAGILWLYKVGKATVPGHEPEDEGEVGEPVD